MSKTVIQTSVKNEGEQKKIFYESSHERQAEAKKSISVDSKLAQMVVTFLGGPTSYSVDGENVRR